MNKREYLRSLGFEVGERGRLSQVMKTALENAKKEGIDLTDAPTKKARFEPVVADGVKPISNETRIRETRDLYGYSEDGFKVAFASCSRCHKHMAYCACEDGIHAPRIITASTEPDVVLYK